MARYKVTDSQLVQALGQGGQPRQLYRVWIATTRGATGYIDVPPDKWNKETLPDILEQFSVGLDLAYDIAEGLV